MRSSHDGRGCPWWGLAIVHVAPVRWGRQRVPLVRGVPVEEGQQGAVRDRFPPHPQPFAAVQLLAQRGCDTGGEHEEQGPLCVAQPGQGVVVYRPPALKCATVSWVAPSSGGCHRTVAAACPHVRISVARSTLAV